MSAIPVPKNVKFVKVAEVAEGDLVFVGGYPTWEKRVDFEDYYPFPALASPSEGGVRFGPEMELFECYYVAVEAVLADPDGEE